MSIFTKYGWKTYLSAIIIGGVAAAIYLGLITREEGNIILELAAALGLVGIGHKLDKLRKGE